MGRSAVDLHGEKLIRVPELILDGRIFATIILVLAEVVLVDVAFVRSPPSSHVVASMFVVLVSLLIPCYLVRAWWLGSRAGMVLRSDGILVRHPKPKRLDLSLGSRFVPWPEIVAVTIVDMNTSGGPFGSVIPRAFLALELTDGTRVCTFGVAVGKPHHRHELIRAKQTVEIARRRATPATRPPGVVEPRLDDADE